MSIARTASLEFGSPGSGTRSPCNLHSTLRRRWDAYDAYLFDIDGTLIRCQDAVHYFAFLAALQSLSGRNLDLTGVTTHGNTDVGILRDALALAGVAEPAWRPRIAEACAGMCAFAKQHQDEFNPIVLPGTRRVLAHLRRRGALLSVATGNLEIIGRMKLQRCGLLACFHRGAFSDGFEFREDVYRHAVAGLREELGRKAAICAVGDTPADIRAAHACGIDVIAVATGPHPPQQLLPEAPNLCVSSLRQLFAAKRGTGRYNG
jgi:phosphoglycolate phosphatase